MIYTSKLQEAVTDKEVELVERNAFHNPEVSMSTVDMVSYAMKVWQSPAKYRSTFTYQNKMKMRLNNIYVVGEYFFIDFSVENNTNLPFDIDELRVKLQDKKQQKSTNVQTIELSEKQISGRTISMNLDYEDVLAADAFDTLLLREE